MKAVVTARRLHPGHFEAFRQAWQPHSYPAGLVRLCILRDRVDRDLVTAFGLFDLDDRRLGEMRMGIGPAEHEREERMAGHVRETLLSGFFDVAWTRQGRPTGEHNLVPFTERRLRPGAGDEFREALAAYVGGMDELPPGLSEVMMLAGEHDPDHVIQFGIVRTDDPDGFSEKTRPSRETMLEVLAPYIESIGIDTTFDLVEEIVPVHA